MSFKTHHIRRLRVPHAWWMSAAVLGLLGCNSEFGGGDPDDSEPEVIDCADESDVATTISAPADPFFDLNDLGRPVDANFDFFQGTSGGPIVNELKLNETETPLVEQSAVALDTLRDLEFNAAVAWPTVLNLAIQRQEYQETRYATYSVRNIVKTISVDDTAGFKKVSPKAVWYVSGVKMGFSHDALIWGHKEQFLFDLKVEVPQIFGLGIREWASERSLDSEIRGTLSPKNGAAIFAKTPEQIEQNYSLPCLKDANGAPIMESPGKCRVDFDQAIPIVVEYTRIPGGCIPRTQEFAWQTDMVFEVEQLEVVRTGGGDSWNSMAIQCQIEGEEGYMFQTAQEIFGAGSLANNQPLTVTQNGETKSLLWSVGRQAATGDLVTCTTSGSAGGQNTGNYQLPVGEFEFRVGENDATEIPLEIHASNESAEYKLLGKVIFAQ